MTRIATKVAALRKQIADLTEYTDYVESLPETAQEFLQR
jgi:hypothetical protein